MRELAVALAASARGVRPASAAEVAQQVRLVEVAGVERQVDGARRAPRPSSPRAPRSAGRCGRTASGGIPRSRANTRSRRRRVQPSARASSAMRCRAARLGAAGGRPARVGRRGSARRARRCDASQSSAAAKAWPRAEAARERLHERPRARPADDRGERQSRGRPRPAIETGSSGRRPRRAGTALPSVAHAAAGAQQPRPRQRAGQEGPRLSPPSAPPTCARERVAEVHDQLGAAVGHDALGGAPAARPRVRDEPQALEVRPQLGARPVLDVAQRHPLSVERRQPDVGLGLVLDVAQPAVVPRKADALGGRPSTGVAGRCAYRAARSDRSGRPASGGCRSSTPASRGPRAAGVRLRGERVEQRDAVGRHVEVRPPASMLPSGDHERGCSDWPPSSSGSASAWRSSSGGVRSTIQVRTPSFVAIRFPSGDQVSSVRAAPVALVSCSMPLPSGGSPRSRSGRSGRCRSAILLAVRRPARAAVAVGVVGELAIAGAVALHDEQVLAAAERAEGDPLPVRRNVLRVDDARAPEHRPRRVADPARGGIEADALDAGAPVGADEHQQRAVAREADRAARARGRRDRLRLAARAARVVVDRRRATGSSSRRARSRSRGCAPSGDQTGFQSIAGSSVTDERRRLAPRVGAGSSRGRAARCCHCSPQKAIRTPARRPARLHRVVLARELPEVARAQVARATGAPRRGGCRGPGRCGSRRRSACRRATRPGLRRSR